jgi:hypothetical protein
MRMPARRIARRSLLVTTIVDDRIDLRRGSSWLPGS